LPEEPIIQTEVKVNRAPGQQETRAGNSANSEVNPRLIPYIPSTDPNLSKQILDLEKQVHDSMTALDQKAQEAETG